MNQTFLISEAELEKMITVRVKEAVDFEREACAIAAEEYGYATGKLIGSQYGEEIAAAIRSRKDAE